MKTYQLAVPHSLNSTYNSNNNNNKDIAAVRTRRKYVIKEPAAWKDNTDAQAHTHTRRSRSHTLKHAHVHARQLDFIDFSCKRKDERKRKTLKTWKLVKLFIRFNYILIIKTAIRATKRLKTFSVSNNLVGFVTYIKRRFYWVSHTATSLVHTLTKSS